jgi:hypothetical protein
MPLNYKTSDSIITNLDLWHPDFFDMTKVLEYGATKHTKDNWLKADKGNKSSFREMHDSMFHHLSRSFSGASSLYSLDAPDFLGAVKNCSRLDSETHLDHLLHLACRALMCYVLIKNGKYDVN